MKIEHTKHFLFLVGLPLLSWTYFSHSQIFYTWQSLLCSAIIFIGSLVNKRSHTLNHQRPHTLEWGCLVLPQILSHCRMKNVFFPMHIIWFPYTNSGGRCWHQTGSIRPQQAIYHHHFLPGWLSHDNFKYNLLSGGLCLNGSGKGDMRCPWTGSSPTCLCDGLSSVNGWYPIMCNQVTAHCTWPGNTKHTNWVAVHCILPGGRPLHILSGDPLHLVEWWPAAHTERQPTACGWVVAHFIWLSRHPNTQASGGPLHITNDAATCIIGLWKLIFLLPLSSKHWELEAWGYQSVLHYHNYVVMGGRSLHAPLKSETQLGSDEGISLRLFNLALMKVFLSRCHARRDSGSCRVVCWCCYLCYGNNLHLIAWSLL